MRITAIALALLLAAGTTGAASLPESSRQRFT
jgi:hypothetical protein